MRPFHIDENTPDPGTQGCDDIVEELETLRIEERPSFGPELEAELERAWAEKPDGRPGVSRQLLAAGVGALLLIGASVPAANGALARFLEAVQRPLVEVADTSSDVPSPTALTTPPPLVREATTPPRRPDIPPLKMFEDGGASAPSPGTTFPELVDRSAAEVLVERYYPDDLQVAAVGGRVQLVLWVDSAGRVAEAKVVGTSGVQRLDRAALAAAPLLRFRPAERFGEPVGTWVEFPLVFEPPGQKPGSFPSVGEPEEPGPPALDDIEIEPEWSRPSDDVPAPYPDDARHMLLEAMGEEHEVEDRWGDLEGLLTGEAPAHALPLRWREEAVEALEGAIVRDPRNPAPFLALGRIRQKQGLRTDARRLFERGISRAEGAERAVPRRVIGDLHYERGTMIRESWLPWRNLGHVPSVAIAATPCSRARLRPPPTTYATGEVLIAWNFLCPGQFDRLMRAHFESTESLKDEERLDMLRSFYGAVDADPGHVGANVEILLWLADEGRWDELLSGAQAFVRPSGGSATASLFAGLALHRLGRSVEAVDWFDRALEALPAAVAAALVDVSDLRRPGELPAGPGPTESQRFWGSLDPLLSTAVNERRVEHLARAAYAHLRFGGADTEAGRVWIRYGRPDHVRSIGEGGGLRTEFWDYGPGPDITFRRPATSLALTLTTEGQAYLDELRQVFPHRYEGGAEAHLALPAQMARFRAAETPGVELEIHFDVPEVMATGPSDSLNLGIYFLGPAGERWTSGRDRLEARAQPVHRRTVVPAGANRVVVELLHPRLGLAATLRSPVASSAPRSGGLLLSDLLLVEPAAPFSQAEVRRTAPWVRPHTEPGAPVRGSVGVLFEVYDLPARDERYRVEIELEELSSGERRPVEFTPAGELDSGFVWDRTARRAARTSEYVTLTLEDLPAGAYLLRVRVELHETGARAEASRALVLN